ncbi:LemA family protein [Methyloligella sp. GL2]|uniref:LemA family protein n=1 Tax=unclassified Methyloligella TaxID=2625955 RepID=UPI00157CE7C9|nr:LemA family protein [Methyloligella sp. GL2]
MLETTLRQGGAIAASGRGNRALFRVIGVMLLASLLGGCGINTIPTLDEQAKAAWSEVANQYQRRADLIPNLVETVKGYASHEKEVLTDVVEARAKATQMTVPDDILTNPEAFQQFQKVQGDLSGALARLLAVVENYPDLKANQNFLALQSQLEGTENRIAIARRDYIEAVRAYNTELRTIPGRWWHALLYSDLQPMENFSVSEETSKAPSVKF